MRLEQYISDLLYRYECVTIPEFGAFLTQQKGAQIHETTDAFYPPVKVISFNSQLKINDGLLAKYVSDTSQTPYEQTLQQIEEIVCEWRQSLQSGKIISLENIGDLSLNNEGNIRFEPSYHLNYLTSSFGLSSFVSSKIHRKVAEEATAVYATSEAVSNETVATEKPVIPLNEEIRRGFRFPWKYAAAAVVIFGVSVLGFREYQSQQQLQEDQKAEKAINTYIQQATFFDSNPVKLPSVTLNVAKEIQNYHIVAGAFRVEENAYKKIAQLKAKGFKAQLLGKNRYGLHQVSYASYASRNDAKKALLSIQQQEAPEAWLLVTE